MYIYICIYIYIYIYSYNIVVFLTSSLNRVCVRGEGCEGYVCEGRVEKGVCEKGGLRRVCVGGRIAKAFNLVLLT